MEEQEAKQTEGQAPPMLRIAAVGDIHVGRSDTERVELLFSEAEKAADVLLLCGDLTDYGLPVEAQNLGRAVRNLTIPVLAVLGNHDYESGHAEEVRQILTESGVAVLDGESHVVGDVAFVGAKGFGGGFEGSSLEPWGEPVIKAFVHEAVEEALKLESALARLKNRSRIVMLHYSPIRETVVGEHPEIMPFLGSRRLEEPLNRFEVTAVFHGHAHKGALEGRTSTGIPVYNVALPLLRRKFPDRPTFRLLEVPRTPRY